MNSTEDAASALLSDQTHSLECMQIVPFGRNRSLALFEIGDRDHRTCQSFIFEINEFRPDMSKLIFCENIWMTSLAAASPSTVFALEVGRTLWSPAGLDWSVSFKASSFMRRIWLHNPNCGFFIGDDGILFRFDGQNWREIEDGDEIALNDIHGQTADLLAVVGDLGSLQVIRGDVVESIDLPFDVDLLGVHVSPGGLIRVAGRDGLCAEVSGQEVRELEAPNSAFFSVTEFKGKTYWGDDEFGVFAQEGTALTPFHETGMGYDMRTDTDFLYCSGSDAMWRFDGEEWLSLRAFYDKGWRLRAS